jgi:hypothetical protein
MPMAGSRALQPLPSPATPLRQACAALFGDVYAGVLGAHNCRLTLSLAGIDLTLQS